MAEKPSTRLSILLATPKMLEPTLGATSQDAVLSQINALLGSLIYALTDKA